MYSNQVLTLDVVNRIKFGLRAQCLTRSVIDICVSHRSLGSNQSRNTKQIYC